ncbi:hypothetical protein Rcae01_00188 [Novipirellula caenicola]|uniref:Uncharacterized protein n=1 Tax=Novipirellula caenicola TaxID=1536901 RepID=A0ABP9VHQ7_9BACT
MIHPNMMHRHVLTIASRSGADAIGLSFRLHRALRDGDRSVLRSPSPTRLLSIHNELQPKRASSLTSIDPVDKNAYVFFAPSPE